MKVIVPMAGTGQRFRDAGYNESKPFIKVRGKCMIEYIIDMFNKDCDEFIFIVNNDDYLRWDVKAVLGQCKHHIIIPIEKHKKGPVWTVYSTASYMIDDDEPVIIAYCDTPLIWDYNKFKKFVFDKDGCIVSNVGFHPHTLSSTVFAHSKTEGDRVLEIKEKSFYNDRFTDHASCGCYYFGRGKYIKDYFYRMLKEDINYNGEYYVTLVYNLLIQDGLDVRSYLVDHVLSFGTPTELQNFEAWMTIIDGSQVKSEEDAIKCYTYWKKYVANITQG